MRIFLQFGATGQDLANINHCCMYVHAIHFLGRPEHMLIRVQMANNSETNTARVASLEEDANDGIILRMEWTVSSTFGKMDHRPGGKGWLLSRHTG